MRVMQGRPRRLRTTGERGERIEAAYHPSIQPFSLLASLTTPRSKRHHMLAQALIQYETLTGDECRDIVNKGKMPKRDKENVEDGAKGDQSILGKGFGIKGIVKG